MQVEVVFPDVPPGALQVRMSRTSPGRYALHEFSKNVYEVAVTDGAGRTIAPSRPNLHQWDIAGDDGTVRVRYRVFGDRVDGTYLGVDATHAHINMPASLMWARGLDCRPARVTFERPAGTALDRRNTVVAHREPVGVHRAQPAVPLGQSGRVRTRCARDVCRANGRGRLEVGRRRFASPCTTPAALPTWLLSSTAFGASSSRPGACFWPVPGV